MKIVLLGLGQVGKPLKEICEKNGHQTYTIELDYQDIIPKDIDIMMVNIPYNNKFIDIVTQRIEEIKPKMVIINSTVDMGTTRSIEEISGIPCAHSPIRGVHPYLKEGIMTFVKYVGATNMEVMDKVVEFFEKMGIDTKAFNSPEETELAKLLCTTTYGEYIAWATEVKRICDKHGLNFDNVYTDWNLTYNVGFMELGMPQVVRPILKPNKGGFSGHCVWENSQILDKELSKDWKHIKKIGKWVQE